MSLEQQTESSGHSELLHEWKTSTRAGQSASHQLEATLAQRHFEHALSVAAAVLAAQAPDIADDDRVAAYVVSHLNLADCLWDKGQTDAAIATVCQGHRALMAILRDDTQSGSLHLAACRHARETHAALVLYWAEKPNCTQILQALREGCLPFPPHAAVLH